MSNRQVGRYNYGYSQQCDTYRYTPDRVEHKQTTTYLKTCVKQEFSQTTYSDGAKYQFVARKYTPYK